MSKLKMLSFGSLDVSNLKEKKDTNFFISIEFDIGLNLKNGYDTFMFFLADIDGLNSYIKNEFKYDEVLVLNKIVLVQKYSYKFIVQYLEDNVVSKLNDLQISNSDIWNYLNKNFIYVND